MAIRECAKNNAQFQRLLYVYENREAEAEKAKAAGKKVIATFGNDVPDEVLIAAGMFPVRVHAEGVDSTETANEFLELNFDEITRRSFEKLVNGYYARLCDHVVIASSTDVLIRAYNYIREIHRTEPDIQAPDEYFVDFLFTRYLQHQLRNEVVMKKFIDRVSEWRGSEITEDELKQASIICNEDRAAIREFCQLRCGEDARVLGSEALVVIGSSLFMDKKEHAALVRELTKAAAEWPKAEGVQIFMTGTVQSNLDLYSLVEAEGGNIVVEDHDWGYRHADTDVDENAEQYKAIAGRYMTRMPNPKKCPVDDHVRATVEIADKTGIKGMLLYSIVEDETFAWDYPSQKKALDEKGVVSTAIGRQSFPLEPGDELKEKVAAFVKAVKEVC